MNRTGLLLSLIVAAVTGLTFALYPELDLKIAGLFYDPVRHDFPFGSIRCSACCARKACGSSPSWWRPPPARSR